MDLTIARCRHDALNNIVIPGCAQTGTSLRLCEARVPLLYDVVVVLLIQAWMEKNSQTVSYQYRIHSRWKRWKDRRRAHQMRSYVHAPLSPLTYDLLPARRFCAQCRSDVLSMGSTLRTRAPGVMGDKLGPVFFAWIFGHRRSHDFEVHRAIKIGLNDQIHHPNVLT